MYFNTVFHVKICFSGGSDWEESACDVETPIRSLDWEDPLEKGKVAHSSIPAWTIPWTEEPGRLYSWSRKELDTTE